jgi:hypothetical protein
LLVLHYYFYWKIGAYDRAHRGTLQSYSISVLFVSYHIVNLFATVFILHHPRAAVTPFQRSLEYGSYAIGAALQQREH